MTTVRIQCLRQTIHTVTRKYPVFVGFMKPSELVKIAVAPAFRPSDLHRELANKVLLPPVSDWQRPLERERVDAIAQVFSKSDDLMPNPVLLSGNMDASPLTPSQLKAPDGTAIDVWEIEVPIPNSAGQKPLWILDGQHRINGLAKSSQADNPIPVVLLINAKGQNAYTGKDFAHIFAQVTVTAKGLNPVHEEWLTYSYELDRYAPSAPNSTAHRSAFQAVAFLCGEPAFDSVKSNPWLNGVVFNPEPAAGSGTSLVGFRYTSPDLKDLFLKHYYNQGGQLHPKKFAEQVAAAYLALKELVQAPQDRSVFFGKSPYAHKVMQDGFLIGVARRLAASGPPNSWVDLLKALNFQTTDWEFNSWAPTRGGNAGNTSRRMAETIFPAVMIAGKLPEGTDNLADYFRGNNSKVMVVCQKLNANGRPIKAGQSVFPLINGNQVSRTLGDLVHLKVIAPGRSIDGQATTLNVGKIEAFKGTSMGKPVKYPSATGGGIDLRSLGDGACELQISMEFYGASAGGANLSLKWS